MWPISVQRKSKDVVDSVEHDGVAVWTSGYHLPPPLSPSTTQEGQSEAIQLGVDKYLEQIGLKRCLVSGLHGAGPDLATLSPRRANIETSERIADTDKLERDKDCIEVEHGNCKTNT